MLGGKEGPAMRKWLLPLFILSLCLTVPVWLCSCEDSGGDDNDTTPPPTDDGTWESDQVDGTYRGSLSGSLNENFTLDVDQNKWLVYGTYDSANYSGNFDGDVSGQTISFEANLASKTGGAAIEVDFSGSFSAGGGTMNGTYTTSAGGSGTWSATR